MQLLPYLFAFQNLLKFPFYPLDSDVGHDAAAYLMGEIRTESASRASLGFSLKIRLGDRLGGPHLSLYLYPSVCHPLCLSP